MAKKPSRPGKENIVTSLDERSVNSDPLVQFSQWFDQAVKAGIGEPDAMVLSTADKSGKVSARVVLLKGSDPAGFVFFTNYQSRKGLQIGSNPWAALTFHWPGLERQVRVEGRVKKTSRQESIAYFNSRPSDSRVSACISPQSAVIPDRSFLEAIRDGLLLDLDGVPPACPANWGGYRLKPTLVEFWQGRESRLHDRIRYRLQHKHWIIERLAP